LKYATVGTSWITEKFIEGAGMVNGMELYAVHSRDDGKAREFAEKTGAELWCTDLGALAKCAEIDGVYIASPNRLHYEQARLLLMGGKHVICEKPIAVTPDEVRELNDIAVAKGLVYIEAMMSLYSPVLGKLRDALKRIGAISAAHFDFSQLSSKYEQMLAGDMPSNFDPRLCGGSLMDIGIYNVYLSYLLFGPPKKVTASSRFFKNGSDGCGGAILDYADKQVSLTYSKIGQSFGFSQIYGNKGTILISSISQLTGIEIIYNDGGTERVAGDTSKEVIMSYEAKAFKDYITDSHENYMKYVYAQEAAAAVSEILKEIRSQNPKFIF